MTINWLCPKPAAPSGGVMFIHRFSNILEKNGIHSHVLQAEPFKTWWDATPVSDDIFSGPAPLSSSDITVIPETMWHNEKGLWPNPVMFCQNWMWLDKRIPLEKAKIIVCSRHLANYVQSNYDGGEVIGIVHPYVASGVFSIPEHSRVENRITIVNRRNGLGARLNEMLSKDGWCVDFIDSATNQKSLALSFQYSDYYAHLISPEGWPQICVEAMQSGTLVVGTTGGSGNEFMFHKETAMVAQDSVYGYDVTDDKMLAQVVEHLNTLKNEPELRKQMRSKAYEWTSQYNEKKTTEELLKVFGSL